MGRQIGGVEVTELESRLLVAIKGNVADLKALYAGASSHWEYEDYVYRFYHQSWKVYGVQGMTLRITAKFHELLPGLPLDRTFEQIVAEGTGRKFSPEVNRVWDTTIRPLLEAFFHARFFLEMMIKYGEELEEPPVVLPSGWAAVLQLYNLR